MSIDPAPPKDTGLEPVSAAALADAVERTNSPLPAFPNEDLPEPYDGPQTPPGSQLSVRTRKPLPPPTYKRTLQRQSSSAFARLTGQATEPSTPTPASASSAKGKARATLGPSSSDGLATAGLPGRLSSVELGPTAVVKNTANLNIVPIKNEIKTIFTHLVNAEVNSDSRDQQTRASLLELTDAVARMSERLPETAPSRALEERVEGMDQRAEQNEDQRDREVANLEHQAAELHGSHATILSNLDGVSSTLAKMQGTLTSLNERLDSFGQDML